MSYGGSVKVKGHYERREGKVNQFFHVSGDQSSGLPGAFVVTEQEAKESGDPVITNEKIVDEDEEELKKLKQAGYEDDDE